MTDPERLGGIVSRTLTARIFLVRPESRAFLDQ